VARGRRHPLQGGGVGVDACRSPAPAGVGRPGCPPPRLRAARAPRPLQAPARACADGLFVRPAGEHAGAAALRGDRDAAGPHVPLAHLLTPYAAFTPRPLPPYATCTPSVGETPTLPRSSPGGCG